MSKIIGNPTTTPNPQSDLSQTDVTKADYVKGKEQFIEEIKKNMPSQSVGIEKTVSGGTVDSVSISGFAIAPIKIKTSQPNQNVTIIASGESGLLGIINSTTDSNGEYELIPSGEEKTIEFGGVICDFTVTYQIDLIEQVEQNTQDIADLKENTNNAIDGSLFTNALKGTVSGEEIELFDVSPIEHTLSVKVTDLRTDKSGEVKIFVSDKGTNTNIQSFPVNSDGTVDGVKSFYPEMALFSNAPGVNIEVTYNKDINKTLGNIDNALAKIIELDNELLGVVSE